MTVAYTTCNGESYPGYINVQVIAPKTEGEEERVQVTLRGDPKDGLCGLTTVLMLTRTEWDGIKHQLVAL